MLSGKLGEQDVDLNTVFEAVGAVKAGSMTEEELFKLEESMSWLWFMFWYVY